jgi:hypothetical protein
LSLLTFLFYPAALKFKVRTKSVIGLDLRSWDTCGLAVNLSSGIIDSQRHDRSSPATRLGWRVSKINHVGCAREDRTNHLALHADSPAVNDAHPMHAPALRLFEVVFNHRANLTRRDRVQIDHVLEFDDDYIGEGIVRVELLAFIFGGLGRRAPGTFHLKLAAKPAEQQIAEHTMYMALLGMIGPVALAVTTNLNINFLRKPEQADVIAECKLLKLGKRLAVGEVTMYSEGDHEPVAHATVTYSIPPERPQ